MVKEIGRVYMEEVIDTNALNDSTDCMHTEDKREWRPDLKLLEMLIQKIIEKLEQNSYEPRVQDALKAIQLRERLVKKSEAEEIFWQQIDDIRDSELEKLERLKSNPEDLQAQILETMTRLQYEVKNGLLPVKTITDAFNRERSKECHLTYQRIGRLLSKMGFQKGKAGNNSAILWDEDMIDRMLEIPPEAEKEISSSE
jgi:vacuolar-type H+-ATPase subunit I/STV1